VPVQLDRDLSRAGPSNSGGHPERHAGGGANRATVVTRNGIGTRHSIGKLVAASSYDDHPQNCAPREGRVFLFRNISVGQGSGAVTKRHEPGQPDARCRRLANRAYRAGSRCLGIGIRHVRSQVNERWRQPYRPAGPRGWPPLFPTCRGIHAKIHCTVSP
jgi:hypothetical protein